MTRDSKCIALALGLVVSGCNDNELAVEPDPTSTPFLGTGAVAGRVCGPAGDVWLADANVYVIRPDGSHHSTLTDLDGYFTLTEVAVGTQTIFIEKGSFSTSVQAEVFDGQVTQLPEPACLDAGSAHVAVVTGAWDDIETILAGVGITDITLYNGITTAAPSDHDLIGDLALLSSYDIVFLNCGTYEQDFFTNPLFVNNLRMYVDAGGSLYASDWAYDFVELAFPDLIEFEGNDFQQNAATVGKAGPMSAAVTDPALATALGGATVSLNYDLGQWVIPTSAADSSRVLVTGDASAFSFETGQTYTVPNSPLAVQFHFGSNGGSVIYTSFHNEPQSTEDMGLILNYMIFEL